MGTIEVGGDTFEVERLSKARFEPSFILSIKLDNPSEVDFPDHETQKVLNVGRRRELTDDYLEERVQTWQGRHPEAVIKGFGVTEEWPARGADNVDFYDRELDEGHVAGRSSGSR
jgi:hypothetical protein